MVSDKTKPLMLSDALCAFMGINCMTGAVSVKEANLAGAACTDKPDGKLNEDAKRDGKEGRTFDLRATSGSASGYILRVRDAKD